jgi:hypothetical protein
MNIVGMERSWVVKGHAARLPRHALWRSPVLEPSRGLMMTCRKALAGSRIVMSTRDMSGTRFLKPDGLCLNQRKIGDSGVISQAIRANLHAPATPQSCKAIGNMRAPMHSQALAPRTRAAVSVRLCADFNIFSGRAAARRCRFGPGKLPTQMSHTTEPAPFTSLVPQSRVNVSELVKEV